MRMLLVGILSVPLIGCSCLTAPQATLDPCSSKACFNRAAASPPIELKPLPSKQVGLPRHRTTTKVASKNATKTAKPSSFATKAEKPIFPQQEDNRSDKYIIASPVTLPLQSFAISPRHTEGPKSIVETIVNVAASGQAAEASDSVLAKAKTTVASKMEDPASVELEDMTRAIRKDPFGQSIDTICGHVSGKKASGAKTGKRAFLYLVKEDIAFVDYGYPGSTAGNAYRTVCTGALRSANAP